MTKKQIQAEQILRHGLRLKSIFNVDLGPVSLCKALRRLEVKAGRIARAVCDGGGYEPPSSWDDKILDAADRLLNFRVQNIPVFVNHDPRGFALKIDSAYMAEHDVTLFNDWGGYGIIAPEFDGTFTAYGVGPERGR